MTHTWMISSAGRRGALVEILRGAPTPGSRVVATDASRFSSAGWLADDFGQVPLVREAGFIDKTLAFARAQNVDVIVPTIDPELNVFATHKELFSRSGVDVFVSASTVTELSWDKWKFSQWLQTQGLPGIRTQRWSELDRGSIAGPVVAKPRNGSSSKGVLFADSTEQLPRELPEDYLVQPQIRGEEITVDFAVGRSGEVLGVVPRRRLETRAGEVSKGVTAKIPVVDSVVRDFASALEGAYGVLNVQVFYDSTLNQVSILELNARVGGGYPLSREAGCDLFGAVAEDKVVPNRAWKEGLMMLRYDSAVFVPGLLEV